MLNKMKLGNRKQFKTERKKHNKMKYNNHKIVQDRR